MKKKNGMKKKGKNGKGAQAEFNSGNRVKNPNFQGIGKNGKNGKNGMKKKK